ncbi:MAG: 16S rRNA (adenine(1518)-N(6)/adenine(1519)-N(6))-dimethyltransferase RsmA [Candidatus Marsarchaeota archaeon]|nr:16S rRNA (adenine(1518)-N(6)/adenine(1519)-N(6))-dimethyltransferase RsmA [Candidatus Marsarchaeota archaeon]
MIVDEDVVSRIVDQVPPGSNVLEVGAGTGALSAPLSEVAGELTLVEVDPSLIRLMPDEVREKATVVEQDFLKWGFKPVDVVVSSVPYSISLKFVLRLVENGLKWKLALLVLQREFVSKLTAEPGSPHYRRISVIAQATLSMRPLFGVPPTAFSPRPRVHSEVILASPRPERLGHASKIVELATKAFTQRNRSLASALRKHYGERGVEAIERIGGYNLDRKVYCVEPGVYAEAAKLL